MKAVRLIVFYLLVVTAAGEAVALVRMHKRPRVSTDPQYAAGEWRIEVQTPPCDSVHNVQVIYPQESGAPLTIECDQMPVPTH